MTINTVPVAPITRGLRFILIMVLACLLGSVATPSLAADTRVDIAMNLAKLLRSARTVIAENQKLINDPSIGDKGLTGAAVITRTMELFRRNAGLRPPDDETRSLQGRLLRAQVDAITEIVDEHQSTINMKGVGFKGFVPAVFARLVNERFREKVGAEADVKVTAPASLVRNRKAWPDSWEVRMIETYLMASDWPRGKLVSEIATRSGRPAFRVMVPEYYGTGCLTCHGGPKGEIDITGYPKEGGSEGGFAGAISITLFQK